MYKKLNSLMIGTCEMYKANYKVIYNDYLRNRSEIEKGRLMEASKVLHEIFGLDDKNILQLEQEVEAKWKQKCCHCNGISKNALNETVCNCTLSDSARNYTLGECFGNCEHENPWVNGTAVVTIGKQNERSKHLS